MKRWLENRLEDAPASLRARILESVTSGTAPRSPLPVQRSPVPAPRSQLSGQLQSLAETLMQEAKSGPPGHDTAMTLLAADALITYACEVVAEQEPEKLGEV